MKSSPPRYFYASSCGCASSARGSNHIELSYTYIHQSVSNQETMYVGKPRSVLEFVFFHSVAIAVFATSWCRVRSACSQILSWDGRACICTCSSAAKASNICPCRKWQEYVLDSHWHCLLEKSTWQSTHCLPAAQSLPLSRGACYTSTFHLSKSHCTALSLSISYFFKAKRLHVLF